jgi:hypothetical protein
MRRAVEEIEGHTEQLLLCSDSISIETSLVVSTMKRTSITKLIRKSTKKSSVSLQCSSTSGDKDDTTCLY